MQNGYTRSSALMIHAARDFVAVQALGLKNVYLPNETHSLPHSRYGRVSVYNTQMRKILYTAITVVAAAGCGPTSTSGTPGADASEQSKLDSGQGKPDSGQGPCTQSTKIEAEYQIIPGIKAANDPWDASAKEWHVSFPLGGPGDPVWELRLHPGRGQLPNPMVAGSYQIGPDDLRFEDCALCAYIRVPESDILYVAEAGTLTVTEIELDKYPDVDVIAGAVNNARYRAVQLVETGDSCTLDSQCINTECGDSGKCLVQAPTNTCGTKISQAEFRTP